MARDPLKILCNEEGSWEIFEGSCERVCAPPSARWILNKLGDGINNKNLSISCRNKFVGDRCPFTCSAGHVSFDPHQSSIACAKGGKWFVPDGTAPCIAGPCSLSAFRNLNSIFLIHDPSCSIVLGRAAILSVLIVAAGVCALELWCVRNRDTSLCRQPGCLLRWIWLGALFLVCAAVLTFANSFFVYLIASRTDPPGIKASSYQPHCGAMIAVMPFFDTPKRHWLDPTVPWTIGWYTIAPLLIAVLFWTVCPSQRRRKTRGYASTARSENVLEMNLLSERFCSFEPIEKTSLARRLLEAELREISSPHTPALMTLAFALAFDLTSASLVGVCAGTALPSVIWGLSLCCKYAAWITLLLCIWWRARQQHGLYCVPVLLAVAIFVADLAWLRSYFGWVSAFFLVVTAALVFADMGCIKMRRGRAHLVVPRLLSNGDNLFCRLAIGHLRKLSRLAAHQLPCGALASLAFHARSFGGVLDESESDLDYEHPAVAEAVSQLSSGTHDTSSSVLDLLVNTALTIPSQRQLRDSIASSFPHNASVDASIQYLWKLALKHNPAMRVHDLRLEDLTCSRHQGLWALILRHAEDPLLRLLEDRCDKYSETGIKLDSVLICAVKMTIAVAPGLLAKSLDGRGYTFLHRVVEACSSDMLHVDTAAEVCRLCVIANANLPARRNNRKIDVTSMALASGVPQLMGVLSMSLHQRFQLVSRQPQHKSETCAVYYCTDLKQEFVGPDGLPVSLVIKTMRDETLWRRELQARREFRLEGTDVLPVLWPQSEEDIDFVAKEARAMQLGKVSQEPLTELQSEAALIRRQHPYSLVLPRAERTLHTVIYESHIAGVDPRAVAKILRDVAMCLYNMHCAGIIHGDVKPRNIVQMSNGAWALIDLDASVVVGHVLGMKASTAYAAPETICYGETNISDIFATETKINRAGDMQDASSQPGLPIAESQQNQMSLLLAEVAKLRAQNAALRTKLGLSPSPTPEHTASNSDTLQEFTQPPVHVPPQGASCIDVWSLGATMFELMAGQSLLEKTVYDHARPSGIAALRDWDGLSQENQALVFQFLPDDEDRAGVCDATDLVTRCLARDPAQRPSLREILAHPFLSVRSVDNSKQLKVSPEWYPREGLSEEIKWVEKAGGRYATGTLEDSPEHKPVSTALLRRITKRFEMGGPRGQKQTKRKVKRVDVLRNAHLTAAFEAAIINIEQRTEAHPLVFRKPFQDDGVKCMLKARLEHHWLANTRGLNHAKVMLTWHGCSMMAMPSICAYGTADLRTTDGGFFGSGICRCPLRRLYT